MGRQLGFLGFCRLSWSPPEQNWNDVVPRGPPRPFHPSCLLQPPSLAAAALTRLSFYCTTFSLLASPSPNPDCSCSILQQDTCSSPPLSAAPPPLQNMQRAGAARQLQTSADPLAPPAVEKSGLGLASCMQLQAQLLQLLRRLPLPCLSVVETRCYSSACLPYGGIAGGGEGRDRSVR